MLLNLDGDARCCPFKDFRSGDFLYQIDKQKKRKNLI
jgi:hypothetical protein